MNLKKKLLERVQPLIDAAMLLLHKFQCPALTFGNALLAAADLLSLRQAYF